MTRIELDVLQLRCTAAFSAYQGHLTAVLERAKGGQPPSEQDLHAEEQALYEYARTRREFLDALASGPCEDLIEPPRMRVVPLG